MTKTKEPLTADQVVADYDETLTIMTEDRDALHQSILNTRKLIARMLVDVRFHGGDYVPRSEVITILNSISGELRKEL